MTDALPQNIVDELAAYMEDHHIQRLTINKGRDMQELKIEASAFSAVKVAARSLDD